MEPATERQKLIPQHRVVVDAAVESYFWNFRWIQGRLLRGKLEEGLSLEKQEKAILNLVPEYLSGQGHPPADRYAPALAGALASDRGERILQFLDVTLAVLKRHFTENRLFQSFSADDIRATMIARGDLLDRTEELVLHRLYILIELTTSFRAPGDARTWKCPQDIERLVQLSNCGAFIEYLKTRRLGPLLNSTAEGPNERALSASALAERPTQTQRAARQTQEDAALTETAKPKAYNLLVSGVPDAWTRDEYVYDLTRYLEYTDDALSSRLGSLDNAIVAELTSLPTLFAYETAVSASARVGWIKSVEPRRSTVRVTFAFDTGVAPIPAERLESLRSPLRIENWEMSRTHWAVKQADLLDILNRGTTLIAAAMAAKGEYRFARQTLLRARDILKNVGHADLDRFFLEVGIQELNASRTQGSRAQRTNALAEYVLANPDERTAEGEPLAMVVVREAAKSATRYPPKRFGTDTRTKAAFLASLQKDGYALNEGQLVAGVAEEAATPPYAAPVATPPASEVTPTTTRRRRAVNPGKPKVFVVHGHNSGAKHEVARFLEQLELEVVILHERPNRGRTLISKFQEESADIEFAVVLMTPDDMGGLAGGKQSLRARQNVIFELGFFIGKLGAQRVCALVSDEIEKPSDFEAVVYVACGSATWKTELARELRHAGVRFNTERVF